MKKIVVLAMSAFFALTVSAQTPAPAAAPAKVQPAPKHASATVGAKHADGKVTAVATPKKVHKAAKVKKPVVKPEGKADAKK
jgi:hypothetical protein